VHPTNHNVISVFNASVPQNNVAQPPFGKILNVWDAVGPAPAAPGATPGPFVNHPAFFGVYDSPTTPAPPTTTYGTNTSGIFISGAIDKGGNVYIVWSMNSARTDKWDIWLAASHDGGQNFYGPFLVSQGGGTSVFPWIAAGDAGRVDVVWYQTDAVGNPNTLTGNPAWYAKFAQSQNAASREPVFSTPATVSDHAIHNGQISTGGTFGSSDRSLLDFFQVAVGPDGVANVDWADNGGGAASTHIQYARQTAGPLAYTNPVTTTCLANPTAVVLSSFGARPVGRAVRVTWRTGSEASVVGFRVLRARPGGRYVRLNGTPIRARGQGVAGATYGYVDRTVRAGVRYAYRLEVLRSNGPAHWAGPVYATARR
jgi:hypothetical protein